MSWMTQWHLMFYYDVLEHMIEHTTNSYMGDDKGIMAEQEDGCERRTCRNSTKIQSKNE
jgi:hypothetical protein